MSRPDNRGNSSPPNRVEATGRSERLEPDGSTATDNVNQYPKYQFDEYHNSYTISTAFRQLIETTNLADLLADPETVRLTSNLRSH